MDILDSTINDQRAFEELIRLCLHEAVPPRVTPILERIEEDYRKLKSEDGVILAQEATQWEQKGLLTRPVRGMRRLSSSTLYSSSGSAHSSVGSEQAMIDIAHEIDIPDKMISEATLRFAGFTDHQAALHWNSWRQRPSGNPYGLQEWVVGRIEYMKYDAEDLQDDWDGVMREWGINQKLRASILSQGFEDIRTTRTAKAWVIDTINRSFLALELIQETSQQRILKEQHGLHVMRRLSTEFPGPLETVLSLRGGKLPEATSTSTRTPGKTILYRGMDRAKTKDLINAETGEYNHQSIYSSPPSDFVGGAGFVVYYALERAAAERYAKYWKQNVQCLVTCVVEMTIDNSLISRMQPVILQYGNEWKKVVWASRKGEKYPRDLRHIEKRSLYIGQICHSHNKAISQMPSWEEITEKNLMYVEEEVKGQDGVWREQQVRATQYVFYGDDVQEVLEKECQFKVTKSKAG